MDIFGGKIILPNQFINQDGDLFLFYLYQYTPFGETHMYCKGKEVPLGGLISGGLSTSTVDQAYVFPRYESVHVLWKKLLQPEILILPIPQEILLDVVAPSPRAERALWEGIWNIIVPFEDCATKSIIAIDNPGLDIEWLTELQRNKCDEILVLENARNMGIQESSAGIKESSADWILSSSL